MPHGERRALVPGSNDPAKWIQLGIVGAAGCGGRGEGRQALLAATSGTSTGQSERRVCFPKRLLELP